MEGVDVIIVGGGIAGLSAAHALVRAGAGKVRLLEREPVLCAHSSGRNAAIFRHLSTGLGDLATALRSRALATELLGAEEAWLRRTGTWFVAATREALEPLARLAAGERLRAEPAEGKGLDAALPGLRGGAARHGLFFAEDGVIDLHALTQGLARASVAAGTTVSLAEPVARIDARAGRVEGVTLLSGERLAAGAVVVAGGAWSGLLGAGCGAPLALEPRRRHLALLETTDGAGAPSPVVWCVDDEVYLRPDSGGLLASPCDEEPWAAELPPPSDAGLELLGRKLARTAPKLADAAVRRVWACLRTFAPDRAAAVGADPRAAGLYWIAGLGGHGMTGGLAAGELLAACVTGRAHPLKDALAPARLVAVERD